MIAEFSLLLMCGMSLMWCLMPRGKVTAGFFRIQMLIVMGLGSLALLTMGQLFSSARDRISDQVLLTARVSIGVGLAAAYVGSILWFLNQRKGGTICMAIVMASSFLALICSRGGLSAFNSSANVFHLASRFATACVLGGSVTGMLLGHWYLTAPTMSIDPLKSLTVYYGAAVLLRLIVSATAWFFAAQLLRSEVQWTWFLLRWLAGIAGPLIITAMTIRILQYRNTQAATGVLFAGVILTFIGEMSAALLYSDLHHPF